MPQSQILPYPPLGNAVSVTAASAQERPWGARAGGRRAAARACSVCAQGAASASGAQCRSSFSAPSRPLASVASGAWFMSAYGGAASARAASAAGGAAGGGAAGGTRRERAAGASATHLCASSTVTKASTAP